MRTQGICAVLSVLAVCLATPAGAQSTSAGAKIPAVHITTEARAGRGDAWFVRGLGARVEWKQGERRTITVDDLNKRFTYDSQAGTVSVTPSSFDSDAGDLFAGFTMAGALADLARGAGDRRDAVKSDSNRVAGRKLFRLRTPSVENSPTIWVDAENERVVRIEAWQRASSGEREKVDSKVEYPDASPLDRSLFVFIKPEGAKFEEAVDINEQSADARACSQNLRQIGLALTLYVRDRRTWPEALRPELEAYISKLAVFRCPADKNEAKGGALTSYLYTRPAPRAARLTDPVRTVLVECDHHPGLALRLNADAQVGAFKREAAPGTP